MAAHLFYVYFKHIIAMDSNKYMQLTDYHAKYYAHELTKRCPSGSLEKLAASLADAQVDLNPNQVDATLFAFRSPLSRGAVFADEVGLSLTIDSRSSVIVTTCNGLKVC